MCAGVCNLETVVRRCSNCAGGAARQDLLDGDRHYIYMGDLQEINNQVPMETVTPPECAREKSIPHSSRCGLWSYAIIQTGSMPRWYLVWVLG